MKSLNRTFFAVLALFASVVPLQVNAASTADILIVVDESGSMSGEHAWISNMITSLDAGLNNAGVSNNRYGLVGFGRYSPNTFGHKVSVGGGDFGTAAELAAATGSLVASGSFEDGYAGIDFGFDNYSFRSQAAVNVILITDEDRDVQSGSSNTYASILAQLQNKNALLNAVVNALYTDRALGIDGTDSFKADGSGGYTTALGGSYVNGYGTTKADYVDLAIATGGAAWDLNQLRAGGLTADSFTKAFIDIKVNEITTQQPSAVPVPAAAFMFAPALLGFVALRKKAKKA